MRLAVEIIKKKRNGLVLSRSEIRDFVEAYTQDQIPDYQMAAFLMATYLQGLDGSESIALTEAMLDSGRRCDFSHLNKKRVDKHSTGGVGDKTSLILAPIVASLGLAVPMISGRGLGHTGGTLDKLESIPGFNTRLNLDDFHRQIENLGLSFIGQTKEICPADRKIYSLRDVTGTVESIPLICASIMSKKLAEDLQGLVFDVKFGSGAFMKSVEQASELAESLLAIGEGQGVHCIALLTNMNQPLGRFAGNAPEVAECLQILRNEDLDDQGQSRYPDTRQLSLELSAAMLVSGGLCSNLEEGIKRAEAQLHNGQAYELFEKVCLAQNGRLSDFGVSGESRELPAPEAGFIESIDVEGVGLAGIELGIGRRKISDAIDSQAGFEFFKKTGDEIKKGEPLVRLMASDEQNFDLVSQRLLSCFKISEKQPQIDPLINDRRGQLHARAN